MCHHVYSPWGVWGVTVAEWINQQSKKLCSLCWVLQCTKLHVIPWHVFIILLTNWTIKVIKNFFVKLYKWNFCLYMSFTCTNSTLVFDALRSEINNHLCHHSKGGLMFKDQCIANGCKHVHLHYHHEIISKMCQLLNEWLLIPLIRLSLT